MDEIEDFDSADEAIFVTTKWLVYFLDPEDYTFFPVALVEAQDEEAACLRAMAAGAAIRVKFADLRARRFERENKDVDDIRQIIECAACSEKRESANDALCLQCLDDFMSSIDSLILVPR